MLILNGSKQFTPQMRHLQLWLKSFGKSLPNLIGIPQTIVTDNGTCFTSVDFESFLSDNGIHHLTTVPYHPVSNGLAEWAVQIVKKGLKKNKKGTSCTRLSRTLFSYQITPQTTTSVSRAELLLKRQPRSKLDLLHPNLAERVERKQQSQKEQHDSRSKEREFSTGTKVWVRNMQRGDKCMVTWNYFEQGRFSDLPCWDVQWQSS